MNLDSVHAWERKEGKARRWSRVSRGQKRGALGTRPGWFLSTPLLPPTGESEEDILGPEGEAGQGEV